MKQPNWAEIAVNDFKVTAEQAQDYLPAAFVLLVSADPHERDELAYPAIATWLETGLLDGQLAQVGHKTIQLLQHREIYARSFAALILAEVLSRDALTRELTSGQLRQLQQEWADWYMNETDLRSHTPALGWLHALAHGADVAAGFAMHP